MRGRNVDYLVPGSAASTGFLPSAGAARTLSSPRGQLRLSASGSLVGYATQETRDRWYGKGTIRGSYLLTSGFSTIEGLVGYELGYSDMTTTLIEQGVAFPLSRPGH